MILTDDQDITLDSMEAMSQTKKLIVDQGLTFTNAFVHTPICCISRSSIVSGRYVHNHHVTNNGLGGGCSNTTWQKDVEPHCFAPHLADAGYQTFYAGKYLNMYGFPKAGGVEHIPPGWSHWFGLVGNSQYYHYSISNNGMRQSFGTNYSTDYYTDVLKRQGLNFLQSLPTTNTPPFMMVLATPAAHAPFTPAPQYNNTDSGVKSPRIPNWNVAPSPTKHQLMQQVPQMDDKVAEQSDISYQKRHGTLRSVDDMVAAVHGQIEKMGLMDDTYFFYTSDHGFHSGQFGMGYDKRQLYENDIRIPYFWKGPGIPKGVRTDMTALNVDIAPTLVEMTSGTVPQDMDGRSVMEFLFNEQYHYRADEERASNVAAGKRQQFVIEYNGEGGDNRLTCCGGWPGFECQICDSWNNTYSCIREIDGENGQVNGSIYCQFQCFAGKQRVEVPCMAGTPQGDGEFYDLEKDYYELDNAMGRLAPEQVKQYENMRQQFLKCAGQTECNKLREGTIEMEDGFTVERKTVPYDAEQAKVMREWKYDVVRIDNV